ncbi:hypothetical protein DL96DRAFT_1716261 [Flagelloscypha sp. PMI_526]|nr:hypothetical protein DL96DRAFT_1716261 [Flagelloscypha sp. PMI_526]
MPRKQRDATPLNDSIRCCGVLSDWSRCSEEKDIPDQFCFSHANQSLWYNSDITTEERVAHGHVGNCIGLDEGGQSLCNKPPSDGLFSICICHVRQSPPWKMPTKPPSSDNLIYLDVYQMLLDVVGARFALGSRLSRRHQAELQRRAAAATPRAAASPHIASSSQLAVSPPPYKHRSSLKKVKNTSTLDSSAQSQSHTPTYTSITHYVRSDLEENE